MVHATPRAACMPIASRDVDVNRFNWHGRCAARQAPFKKRRLHQTPRANRAGTVFCWLYRPLLDCICWAVSAGCNGRRLGCICWLYLLSKPQPKAETASIKQRPKAATVSRHSQHQATAEGRAESRGRKQIQPASSNGRRPSRHRQPRPKADTVSSQQSRRLS